MQYYKIVISVLIAAMMFVFFGCGEQKAVIVDAEALAGDISEIYNDSEIEFVDIVGEAIDARYGLKGLYSFIHVEGSITVTADEILVMEAIDEVSAEKAYELLKSYRDERIELFASYAAGEVPKLENALLKKAGKYLLFVVSEDIADAEEIWKDYVG